jgi:predicted permease
MQLIGEFWRRLAFFFGCGQFQGELKEEMDEHVRMKAKDLADEGMPPDEARNAARREFGNALLLREKSRDPWGFRWLETLLQDLRYGLRQRRRNPGFTAVAVITLALGIGANTAIFSLVNGVLLNPLPYRQPSRLVVLYSDHGSISYPNFLDWVRDSHSFSALAGYLANNFSLTGVGKPERVQAEMISASFFPILGVKPIIGRNFTPREDRLGAASVVLLSGSFWKRKFGASPEVVGKAIELSGTAYTVIGVVPPDFHYLDNRNFAYQTDVYVPIGELNDPTFHHNRSAGMGMDALGRLKPGVTLAQAKADMDAVAKHLAEMYPVADKGSTARLVPLKQDVVGDIQPYVLMLLAAVGFVLLIACVNVANLLLARASSQAREFAVRIALGAGRGRVIRQLLTESVLLALAGGGVGLLVATWGLQAALKFLPGALPRAGSVQLDAHVLLFTITASVLSGTLFGLAPAFRLSSTNLQETLKKGGRGASGARLRTQSTFVVAEIALAIILLAGAGLMIRSLADLWGVDPGFDPHHLLVTEASFPPAKSPDAIRETWRELHDRIAALPGVQAASLSVTAHPFESDSEVPFWMEGQPRPATESQMKVTLFYTVQPGYLRVMKIPLLRGRFLNTGDTQHAPFVTAIDRDFARHYYPGQNPVGKRINFDILNATAEIVGVVGHVEQWGLDESGSSLLAQCYFSVYQIPDRFVPLIAANLGIVARTAGPPPAEIEAIRHAVEKINSQAVISNTETMDGIVSGSLATQRFSMILMAIFAALALIMASVGIYGVISHVTSQRGHEIGIRVALGAQRSDVLRLVLGHGLRLALMGVAIGVGGGLVLMRFLSRMLYGVKPTDPLTFIAVSIILATVAALACYIPARRAAKVDPVVALRYEKGQAHLIPYLPGTVSLRTEVRARQHNEGQPCSG